jgi:hypothetical protein
MPDDGFPDVGDDGDILILNRGQFRQSDIIELFMQNYVAQS